MSDYTTITDPHETAATIEREARATIKSDYEQITWHCDCGYDMGHTTYAAIDGSDYDNLIEVFSDLIEHARYSHITARPIIEARLNTINI